MDALGVMQQSLFSCWGLSNCGVGCSEMRTLISSEGVKCLPQIGGQQLDASLLPLTLFQGVWVH